MTVHLDHLMVPARNKLASAKLLADLLLVFRGREPAWGRSRRFM
jgi:hypothetical protein